MRLRDEAVLDELAEQLRRRTGLADDDDRARVMANLMMFLAAFAPMRDWLTRDIDNQLILDTVADAVAAMVEHLPRG